MVRIDNKRPKINAHRKPFIEIPETNLSASSMIITLMTKRNSPNVIIVRGSVKRISKGFTIKLSTANTRAKITAVVNEFIVTCGANNFERRYTTSAVISIFIMNLIKINFFESYSILPLIQKILPAQDICLPIL